MRHRMVRTVLMVTFAFGGLAALAGGVTLGVLTLADPHAADLERFQRAWILLMLGFTFLAVCTRAVLWLTPASGPAPRPNRTSAPPTHIESQPPSKDPAVELQRMRTYVDLGAWDLALERANAIITLFPGSPEAETVLGQINEIRWKAEPKPAANDSSVIKVIRKQEPPKEEIRDQIRHIRTYMELEMWELAREKAQSIARRFPDSPEGGEARGLLEAIESQARAPRPDPQASAGPHP